MPPITAGKVGSRRGGVGGAEIQQEPRERQEKVWKQQKRRKSSTGPFQASCVQLRLSSALAGSARMGACPSGDGQRPRRQSHPPGTCGAAFSSRSGSLSYICLFLHTPGTGSEIDQALLSPVTYFGRPPCQAARELRRCPPSFPAPFPFLLQEAS